MNKENDDRSISKEMFHSIISGEMASTSKLDPSAMKNDSKKRHFSERSKKDSKIIVSFLHESCASELPVTSCETYANHRSHSTPMKVVLFMGAVRDMKKFENENLASVCESLNIPLVGCRLGPVPEFTSKILQILTFHCAMNRLKPALRQLHQNKLQLSTKKMKVSSNHYSQSFEKKNYSDPRFKNERNRLHFIATLTISSSELTSSLPRRSYVIWTMVRLIVCALWRSRVASSRQTVVNPSTDESQSTTAWNLENIVSFVFNDGLSLTIKQNDLVDMLAEKHQAAPSEYQILEALCQLRDRAVQLQQLDFRTSTNDNVIFENTFGFLVSSEIQNLQTEPVKEPPFLCALELFDDRTNVTESITKTKVDKYTNLFEIFYSKSSLSLSMDNLYSGTALVFLHIEDSKLSTENVSSGKCRGAIEGYRRMLRRTLSNESIPLIHDLVVPNQIVDHISTSVTMLQHLVYQRQLFGLLKTKCALDGKKSKCT